MSWTWNPREWRTVTKLLLGLATVWPMIYMVGFFALIFTILALASPARGRGKNCGDLDPLALDQKNGEIKELM